MSVFAATLAVTFPVAPDALIVNAFARLPAPNTSVLANDTLPAPVKVTVAISVETEPTFKFAFAELSIVKAVALAIFKVVVPVEAVPLSFKVILPAFASTMVVPTFVPP